MEDSNNPKVPEDVLAKFKELRERQKALEKEYENLKAETDIIWPFSKCKELECRHTKGQKTYCGNIGCIHCGFDLSGHVNYEDLYEKKEKPVKKSTDDVPMLNLTGKYVFCYKKDWNGNIVPHSNHPIVLVEKETACMLKLSNGDSINKRTMTYSFSTQWYDYGYSIRPATEEEIQKYKKN